jgi:sporulation protein YlmC with PRC-barrel domain
MRMIVRAAVAALGILANTANATSAPGAGGGDARASKWLGRAVNDEAGRHIGRVSDAWLDLAGRENGIVTIVPEPRGQPMACSISSHGLTLDGGTFVAHTALPAPAAACAASPHALAPGAAFESVKTLLGAPLKSADGDDVGVVRDIVLRAGSGRVHYILADFNSNWVLDGKLTILPARPLRRERDNFWMRVDLNELQRFPMVDADRIDDVAAPSFSKAVDRYFPGDAAPAGHATE